MHIKYCYLLKLTWHAVNILGADSKGGCSTRLPQWDGREMWGMCPMAVSFGCVSHSTNDDRVALRTSLNATCAVPHHNVVLLKWMQSPFRVSLPVFWADSASGMSARSLESLCSGLECRQKQMRPKYSWTCIHWEFQHTQHLGRGCESQRHIQLCIPQARNEPL